MKNKKLVLSKKGESLVNYYKQMVNNGYPNNLFNLKLYKEFLKETFENFNINSILDYGSGRVNWESKNFDEIRSVSAKNYFKLKEVSLYDPSIDIDNRKKADCVLSFDVLEHIFISDIKNVLDDIFVNATKLVVIQVACYPAKAKLPNGENAHVLIRNPLWWKGLIDSMSLKYPNVSVCLLCSTEYKKTVRFNIWSANEWLKQEKFESNI